MLQLSFLQPWVWLSAGFFFTGCSDKNAAPAPPPPPPPPAVDTAYGFESTAFWTEEFDYNGLPDANKWGYDVGGGGWGNNELQYYTSGDADNAQVSSGVLRITARKESFGGRGYTSTRLVSREKADFLYGRMEVRAKLPLGKGTWPAIWMLPTDWVYGGWPKSGEIDIMEHVGFDTNMVHFSIHTEAFNHMNNTQKTAKQKIPTATSTFHTYRLDWTPKGIEGFFDGNLVFSFPNPKSGFASWPFDKRFHLLLNIAVGGNWGGLQGVDDSCFPATMEIDYLRFYKLKVL